MKHSAIGLAIGSFLLFAAPPIRAQGSIFTVTGNGFNANLGHGVAGAGDVNRDGVPDVAIGLPGGRARPD